jgi:hypothetical protein
MDEEAQDMPYLKFLSAEVVTPVVTVETAGVWGTYEVVNIGTAPTTREDSVTAFVSYRGAQIHYVTHEFEPVVEANGGSRKGNFHCGFEALPYPGDWELSLQINRGINKGISDVVTIPFQVVQAAHV